MISRRRFLQLLGGVAGASMLGACPVKLDDTISLESTLVPDETADYSLVDVVEQTLSTGFEQPDELAAGPEIKEMIVKNAASSSSKKDVSFCTTPVMDYLQTYFVQNPIIYKYTKGNSLVNFFEFTLADINDFKVGLVNPVNPTQPNSNIRPQGLSLSTIILNDGSVLFVSNMSQKIHEINTQGNKTVYLDDEKLVGTTDMIMGSDGKIYCAQGPILRFGTSGWETVRPTGVISIDPNNGNAITQEFQLGGALNTGHVIGLDNNVTYSGTSGPVGQLVLGHVIKMHENNRKDVKNCKFYVSDMFEKTLYSVSDSHAVEAYKTDLRFPSTLTMGKDGKLFLFTGLISDPIDIALYDIATGYEPELIVVNPKKDTIRSLHKFLNEGGQFGGYVKDVDVDQNVKYLPVGHKMSAMVVDEDNSNIEFYFNNSINGSFRSLIARKIFDP